ncbi:hypothetical protein GCM10009113_14620 [Marinobacter szutsaonensis]
MSLAITTPLSPTRSTATWDQPPGAAPRSTKLARPEQLVLLVQLNEFVTGAGAISVFLRLSDPNVVEMFLEPAIDGLGPSQTYL